MFKYLVLTRNHWIKLEALTAVQSSRKEIELGPRPGQRRRSGIILPLDLSGPKMSSPLVEFSHDSEPEAEREETYMFDKEALLDNMVDLDGSSDVEGRG